MADFNRGTDQIYQGDVLVKHVVFGLANRAKNFGIADMFFPPLISGAEFDGEGTPMAPLDGTIAVYADGSFFVGPQDSDLHQDGADVNISRGPRTGGVAYHCQEFARGCRVPDMRKLAAAQALGINQVQNQVGGTIGELATLRDRRATLLLGTPGNWAAGDVLIAAEQWNQATANPVEDIRAARAALRLRGVEANAVCLTERAAEALATNAVWLDNRPTDTDRTDMDEDEIQAVFRLKYGITKFKIVRLIENTSHDPDTFTPGYIAANLGEWMWIGYVPDVDQEQGLGTVEGLPGGMGEAVAIAQSATFRIAGKDWDIELARETTRLSDVGVISYAEALGILQNDLGYVVSNIL